MCKCQFKDRSKIPPIGLWEAVSFGTWLQNHNGDEVMDYWYENIAK